MTKADELVALIEKLLTYLGVEASVKLQDRGRIYAINIETDDSALLIGRHGETLEALQLIARLVASRLDLGEDVRVMVDVNSYRRSREEDLLNSVNEAADRVLETGQAETLRPMTSYERHLVHEVVGQVADVVSESTGFGPDRRVTIRPLRSGEVKPENKED